MASSDSIAFFQLRAAEIGLEADDITRLAGNAPPINTMASLAFSVNYVPG